MYEKQAADCITGQSRSDVWAVGADSGCSKHE